MLSGLKWKIGTLIFAFIVCAEFMLIFAMAPFQGHVGLTMNGELLYSERLIFLLTVPLLAAVNSMFLSYKWYPRLGKESFHHFFPLIKDWFPLFLAGSLFNSIYILILGFSFPRSVVAKPAYASLTGAIVSLGCSVACWVSAGCTSDIIRLREYRQSQNLQ